MQDDIKSCYQTYVFTHGFLNIYAPTLMHACTRVDTQYTRKRINLINSTVFEYSGLMVWTNSFCALLRC